MIVKFNLEIWQTYDICAALSCQNLGQENVVFHSVIKVNGFSRWPHNYFPINTFSVWVVNNFSFRALLSLWQPFFGCSLPPRLSSVASPRLVRNFPGKGCNSHRPRESDLDESNIE